MKSPIKFVTGLISSANPKNSSLTSKGYDTLYSAPFSVLRNSTLSHYSDDRYENSYSSIRAIANRFMVLRPHAIDENGKKIDKTPDLINALARPNQDMSGVDFRDALAVMTMVHDKVYVLIHEIDGKSTKPASENVSEDRIAGFTFLENVQEEWIEGVLRYNVYVRTQYGSEQRHFYPYQVAVLHDTNPGSLSQGYSPSKAARRWISLDDYIADYQSGFFENGAVPSGQFVITAPTPKEFNDIVDVLQARHQGAGKNNNVTYSHRPIDLNSGKPGESQIEWIPFNVSNKDHSLKDIFEQTNKKIDSVYGVSAFIRAIDEAPNFATAQVIERNFVENTVRPFAIKKWARFQHEMNRITGGLGYGIAFELETPHIAEEDSIQADADNKNWTTVKDMITSGVTYESAVKALKLPPNWTLLEFGETKGFTVANDKPEVDNGDEVVDSPDMSNGGRNRTDPKVNNKFTEPEVEDYTAQLQKPVRKLMQSQVDRAVAELTIQDAVDATDTEIALATDELMTTISSILAAGGAQQWEEGKLMIIAAGFEAPSASYQLTDEAIDRYATYLKTVLTSYAEDTANSLRAVLLYAETQGLTKAETEKILRAVMDTDEWRITRLSTTEMNRSGALSSVEAMRAIQDDTEISFEKSMMTTGANPCEYCLARVDEWFPVDSVMVPKGATLVGVDGGIMINDWDDNEGHDIHPFGNCTPKYRVAAV